MRPGLYLAVRPLRPPEGEEALSALCATLHAELTAAFPLSDAYVNAVYPPPHTIPASETTAARRPSPRVAYPRLLALALLATLMRAANGNPADHALCRDANGRPYVTALDGAVPFDFNLTHSAAHVGGVLLVVPAADSSVGRPLQAPLPPRVGLDIEEPIPPDRAARLAARFCTDGEHRLLETAPAPSAHEPAIGVEISNYRQNSPNHRDLSPWHNRGTTAVQPWTQSAILAANAAFLSPISDFTRLWTTREAIAKQDGRGGPLGFDAASPPPHVTLLSLRVADTHASLTLCLPTAHASFLDTLDLV